VSANIFLQIFVEPSEDTPDGGLFAQGLRLRLQPPVAAVICTHLSNIDDVPMIFLSAL
jgi:hypothetical protein